LLATSSGATGRVREAWGACRTSAAQSPPAGASQQQFPQIASVCAGLIAVPDVAAGAARPVFPPGLFLSFRAVDPKSIGASVVGAMCKMMASSADHRGGGQLPSSASYISFASPSPRRQHHSPRTTTHQSLLTNHGFSNRHLAIRNGRNSLKTNDGCTF
jgi:hypothetical protein